MNTDLRTADVNGTHRASSAHGSALKLLLSLIVLATAGCGDLAPPAASANVRPQPDLPAPGPTLRTAPANVSLAATGPPETELTASADEIVIDRVASSKDKASVVFLHGLHSPFGMALAMSRIPTPR